MPPNSLVEVTCRTVQSRFLLRPSPELVDLFLGIVGRAQRFHGMKIHALAALSNHYHLLVTARDAQQLSHFMGFVNSNLAREIGTLASWREKFWGRRYQAIVVSDEEAAQVQRLRYVLAHGAKEGLVRSPREWPGVHCANALCEGSLLQGRWFDRTAEFEARRRGARHAPDAFATGEVVYLQPLPCWSEMPQREYRARVRALVEEIEENAAAANADRGRQPLGAWRICRQHPHDRPAETAKGSAPKVHAVAHEVRKALLSALRSFTVAFRDAAEQLRQGVLDVMFPEGSFPPGLAWVPHRSG